MEKTINCAECGDAYTYNAPEGYPDKRKYCASCSAAKKAQWENKDAAPSPENRNIDAGVRGASLMSAKDVSITAQCLTKCFASSDYEDPKVIMDAYRFFVLELEQNG